MVLNDTQITFGKKNIEEILDWDGTEPVKAKGQPKLSLFVRIGLCLSSTQLAFEFNLIWITKRSDRTCCCVQSREAVRYDFSVTVWVRW